MSKIDFSLSESFDTIQCPECGMEFLLFGIHRHSETGYYGEELVDTMLQVVCSHCPYCGADCSEEKADDAHDN